MRTLPDRPSDSRADAHVTFDESPESDVAGVINFRSSASVPDAPAANRHVHLHGLHLSGSSQFDAHGVVALRALLAAPLRLAGARHVHVIDCRQELHGAIGGRAVGLRSAGNQGSGDVTCAELLEHERLWLAAMGRAPAGTPLLVWRRNHGRLEPEVLPAAPTLGEAALLAQSWQSAAPPAPPPAAPPATPPAPIDWPTSCAYTRLPMRDGAAVLPDASVDGLVRLVREELPAHAWVHVHCLHGHGRTSLVMLCYDIVVSASKLDLAPIVARQRALPQAQAPDTHATRHFLRRLHRYCRLTDGVPDAPSWTAWRDRADSLYGRLCAGLCVPYLKSVVAETQSFA